MDVGDGGDGGEVTPYFQNMPEDWRTQAVGAMGIEPGEDFDKRVTQLERVSDFGVLAKNYFSAQDKIRAGEISNGLPENPSDEQVAQWREANGVPAEVGGYELSLDEGLVLGEADERIMEGIYGIAHTGNVPGAVMNEMTNAMLKGRQVEAEARITQDGVDKQMTNQQLKDAWGGDFEMNTNMVRGLVNQLPESVKDTFSNARMADGKALFNSPEIMIAMAEWARKINPSATVVPNSSNPMQTMNDEIKTLEDRMGEPDWHKDKAANDRLMALYDARDSMAKQ